MNEKNMNEDYDRLVEGLKSGDELSYLKLFDEFSQRVFSTAYHILWNKQEAEDTTQETFIKIYKKIQTFEGNSRLTTWILRIAINTALDRKRSQTKLLKRRDFEFWENEKEVKSSPKEAGPDFQYIINETESNIRDAIESLPKNLRLPFQLGVIEKLSYQDVSMILDISLNSVKMNIYRARKVLKKKLVDLL